MPAGVQSPRRLMTAIAVVSNRPRQVYVHQIAVKSRKAIKFLSPSNNYLVLRPTFLVIHDTGIDLDPVYMHKTFMQK